MKLEGGRVWYAPYPSKWRRRWIRVARWLRWRWAVDWLSPRRKYLGKLARLEMPGGDQ